MLRARRKSVEELARSVEFGEGKGSEHELVRVFEQIERSFDPGHAPVERIVEVVTEAVERQALPAPPRRSRRFSLLWRPALIFTALGVLASLTIVSEPLPPNAVAVVEGALSALGEPGKITYYKIVSRSSSEFEEHWVDYEREMQKSLFWSGGKQIHRSLTKDGRSKTIEGSGSNAELSDNRAIQPFSDRLKDEIGNYRFWIKEGIRPTRETVGGVETLKIQKERFEDIGRVDGRKMKTVWSLNVRRDNFHPVRISYDAYFVDASGELELQQSQVQEIQGLKLFDPSVLPPDLFTLDIPEGAPYRINDTYTLKNIGEFKEFDAYYIGERLEQFKFDGGFSFENELNTKPLVQGLPQAMLRVNYVNDAGDDGLSMLIWPKFDPNVLLAASHSRGRRTHVDIDGSPATLVETDWGAISTSVLLMERGSSVIQMEGKQTDVLMRAARKLVKVN